MKNKVALGHLFAIITIIIWGTTYISTKVLLTGFTPVEILFTRFIMGLIALFLVKPVIMKPSSFKEELTYALAGISGISLYYLLENVALTKTFASNVGVIISVAPFFTAMVSKVLLKKSEKISLFFYIGFVIAMVGIYILTFKSNPMKIDPVGDLLALLAAVVWAFYSILIKKAESYKRNTILVTRRVFEYGLVFMIPMLFMFDCTWDFTRFSNPKFLFNIIFLGLFASAFCFVSWNFSVKILGAIKTSVYIYLVPVITLVSSVIILHEPVNALTLLGAGLTMSGLFISQK